MLSRSELARRQARSIGRVAFRGRWNLAELLDDCESVAWQLEQKAPPYVGVGPIAYLAVQRVKIGRQFLKRSIRSIDTGWQDNRAKRPRFTRADFQLEYLAAPDLDPAEVAGFWIDYEAWLASLNRRKRKLAELLATGETTRNAAKRFRVSDGRISQIRKELRLNWERFVGEDGENN